MLEVAVLVRRGSFVLDACFAAPRPGVTALFGRSGSGKSTLVGALCGLLRGAQGTIRIGGEAWLDSARGVEVPAERRHVGCVFQEPRLFPHLDVAGNLDYAARRARGRTPIVRRDEAVELLGLEALLARRVAALSGGERSRVALGRALLSQPRLLVLDEPLASLDAPRREEILPYLERLRDHSALSMVYVSHDYDEVLRLAGHVVLLDAGRVRASGSPAGLSLQPALVSMVGLEHAGAVVEGCVEAIDAAGGLATVRVGAQRLLLPGEGLVAGRAARVLVPARDVLLATVAPQGLSVRNRWPCTVVAVEADARGTALVSVDAAGTTLLARVTVAAVTELDLRPGRSVQALIKAEALRGHVYGGRGAAAR